LYSVKLAVRRAWAQGGSGRGVALTAYVLISLLENSDNVHVSKHRLWFFTVTFCSSL